MISECYSEAAGRPLSTGAVLSPQTFGEYASWHPRWPMIVLEGGFDQHDRFHFITIGTSEKLLELWRRQVIAFFVDRNLLNADMAASMLGWHHSGFSVESGTRIYDDSARQSLAQYIIRAPVGLEKLTWNGTGTRATCPGRRPRTATSRARRGISMRSTSSLGSPCTSRILGHDYAGRPLHGPRCQGQLQADLRLLVHRL